MASNEPKWRHVERAEFVLPHKDNPVVSLLASYGIPYDRISGQYSTGDFFTNEKRFADYGVYIFGVSSDEHLPYPQLAWNIGGKEYACWEIQIYWKDYNGRIDAIWREEFDHYEVVTRWGGLGQLDRQAATAMDEGMNLLFDISQRMPKVTRGGRHNVKVADLPDETKRALGVRYKELKDSLTNIKKDVQTLIRLNLDWQSSILKDPKYGVLKNHPDLLKELHLRGSLEPWQIAIEIAARETIPDYKPKDVSANTLKNIAILPDNQTK